MENYSIYTVFETSAINWDRDAVNEEREERAIRALEAEMIAEGLI